MEKNTIIDIIANDLKEMQLLLETFKKHDKIPEDFIALLATKNSNVEREIQLLNYWKMSQGVVESSPAEPPAAAQAETPQPEVKIEPQIVVEPTPVEPAPQPEVVAPQPQSEPAPQPQPSKPTEPTPQPKKQSASDITNYGTPVDDIKKALGINDRFLYQRELFGGDATAFNSTLDIINQFPSYNDARQYLVETFAWDETEPVAEAFMKSVYRRFL